MFNFVVEEITCFTIHIRLWVRAEWSFNMEGKLIIAIEESNMLPYNLIRICLDFVLKRLNILCWKKESLHIYTQWNLWNHSLEFMANEMYILLPFFQRMNKKIRYRFLFFRCVIFFLLSQCSLILPVPPRVAHTTKRKREKKVAEHWSMSAIQTEVDIAFATSLCRFCLFVCSASSFNLFS